MYKRQYQSLCARTHTSKGYLPQAAMGNIFTIATIIVSIFRCKLIQIMKVPRYVVSDPLWSKVISSLQLSINNILKKHIWNQIVVGMNYHNDKRFNHAQIKVESLYTTIWETVIHGNPIRSGIHHQSEIGRFKFAQIGAWWSMRFNSLEDQSSN